MDIGTFVGSANQKCDGATNPNAWQVQLLNR